MEGVSVAGPVRTTARNLADVEQTSELNRAKPTSHARDDRERASSHAEALFTVSLSTSLDDPCLRCRGCMCVGGRQTVSRYIRRTGKCVQLHCATLHQVFHIHEAGCLHCLTAQRVEVCVLKRIYRRSHDAVWSARLVGYDHVQRLISYAMQLAQ